MRALEGNRSMPAERLWMIWMVSWSWKQGGVGKCSIAVEAGVWCQLIVWRVKLRLSQSTIDLYVQCSRFAVWRLVRGEWKLVEELQ